LDAGPDEHRRVALLVAAVRCGTFPQTHLALARRNLLLGRLTQWCLAAAAFAHVLLSENAVTDDGSKEADALSVQQAERAAQQWLTLCASARLVRAPVLESPPLSRLSPLSQRRQRPAAKRGQSVSLPPPSPTLYGIFQAERRAINLPP